MTVSNIDRLDARHARQTAADKPRPELAGLSVRVRSGESRELRMIPSESEATMDP